ncbi:MAG: AAA family ATPase [Magnetococcales bacterium]|nr:AAA family ATPase [Magnetococcales bacterium]
MLIQSLKITNLLSFGPNTPELPLQKLNIIIGANGSGKSNFLEAVSLLQAAPKELNKPIRDAGGISEWLWKGGKTQSEASIEALLTGIPRTTMPLRHHITIRESAHRLEVSKEIIANSRPGRGHTDPTFYYKYENGRAYLNYKKSSKPRELQRESIHPEQSILSQRKDVDSFPEVSRLGEEYNKIRMFREWTIGRFTAPRSFQDSALRNAFLEEDFSNLAMVVNSLKGDASSKRTLIEYLNLINSDIDDFDVQIEGGKVQVFFHEKGMKIPATRLSDGTLRYLCLLTILCHPSPPPLLCIEEPELGMHPDIIPTIAILLKAASERSQIIVTTHSDILVDEFTDSPESIIACDKKNLETVLRRLDRAEMASWLGQYRLGNAWLNGRVGAVRW